MDVLTYFDLIPDELIIIIFTYTRSNINISNRLNNLYTVFIDNIKKGLVNPDDVFDSTTDIDDPKKDLLYNIKMIKEWTSYSAVSYLQLNNNDTFLDRTSSKSYEVMSKIVMNMNKIYLKIYNTNAYEPTIHFIFRSEESFVYVRSEYYRLICIGSVTIKTEKNWKKFYTEILNEELRKSLFLENRYIIR